MSVWGKILEHLRKWKGISQGDLSRRLVIGKDEYYRLCRSKRGPTIATLEKLLVGMNCTWHDWALAYETIKASSNGKSNLGSHTVSAPAHHPSPIRKSIP